MHGLGTLTSSGGDVYVGEFVEGKQSGTGKLVYASGDIYVGGWKMDLMHGTM